MKAVKANNKKRKSIALIVVGLLNILHASSHLIQFIQSLILISLSKNSDHESGIFEMILHNPILNIIWIVIGVFTLYLGIKDFKHHKKCKQ